MNLSITVIVSLAIGVLVVAMVLGMLTNWNFVRTSQEFINVYFELGEERGLVKGNTKDLVRKMQEHWIDCNFNQSNITTKLYVEGEGLYRAEDVVSLLLNLSWCDNLQIASRGCGIREDLNMSDITLPEIVIINCANKTLFVRPASS